MQTNELMLESLYASKSLYKITKNEAELKESLLADVNLLKEDTEFLTESIGAKIAKRAVKPIDRDIQNLDKIISLRKKKGQSTKEFESKQERLQKLKDGLLKDAQNMTPGKVLIAVISYVKTLIVIATGILAVLGVVGVAAYAKKFGVDNLNEMAKKAVDTVKSGKDAKITDKDAVKKTIDGTKKLTQRIKTASERGERLSQAATTAAQREKGDMARSSLTAMKADGTVDVDKMKQTITAAQDRTKNAQAAAAANTDSIAKSSHNYAHIAIIVVKVIAIAIVVSVLVSILTRMIISYYAGKLTREQAKKMAEGAVNKSAGKVNGQVKGLKAA